MQIKNLLKQIIVSICLVFFTRLIVNCTEPTNNVTKIAVGEKIQLLTDRNLYAVQELVFFNAIYTHTGGLHGIDWSRVIYIELLNQDGQVELQQKLPLHENGAFGSFKLPKELLTGCYYLRAYTKWMVNFGPEAFSYAKIIVVNPYNEQIYSVQDNTSQGNIRLNDKPDYQLASTFSVGTDKARYKKRERVKLKLNLDEPFREEGNFTVSVVKTNSLDNVYMAGSINTSNQSKPISLQNIEFLPESRGMGFSGNMNNVNGQTAKKGKVVNLSIIGDKPYFAQTYTAPDGEFHFTLPEQEGELNLFLCPSGFEETDVIFKVNSGFANFHYPINSGEFNLTGVQMEMARELVINNQITSIYLQEYGASGSVDSTQPEAPYVYFYGTPEQRIFLDEYIVLPNLGEVFFELVPDVLLLKKKKISYLQVVNENHWSSTLPLVLLDHIPVYDLSSILGIHSQKFEWIDVVNTNYLKGKMLYSGIISIFSRNNDIAGAELPKGGTFFSYKSFEEQKNTIEEGKTSELKNIPDLRNCLYWNPNFSPDGKQQMEIEFYTSDNTGEYTVMVRKAGRDGTGIIQSSCIFNVK